MIVGATGVFGSRLLEQLIQQGHQNFILAGRDQKKARPILQKLHARNITASFVVFDRNVPQIGNFGPSVLIDAAGPFQNSSLALAEAALAAGINYIDLADARDFVARIPSLDSAAKQANVSVITGASSSPAISHAAIDHLTKGWKRIDKILVAIVPGNRAPRGLSVVKSILSYVGEPITVFREGAFTTVSGWSRNRRITIDGVGERSVAICDTPDLDLLVKRYNPTLSAEFKAGLELGIMHHSLRVLSWLRARRLVPPLKILSSPLLQIAKLFYPMGSDDGGMLVEVHGLNSEGSPIKSRWSMAAKSGLGPNVPALPVTVLIAKLNTLPKGAYAASGHVHLDDITPLFNKLGITSKISHEAIAMAQLFEKTLSTGWAKLPEITRQLHTITSATIWEGTAHVEGAENFVGRQIAKFFGMPVTAQNVPVRVCLESDDTWERWARVYPTRTMRSVMSKADATSRTVEEHLGPFRFRLRLEASEHGLDMHPESAFLGPLPLPKFLLPKLIATERVGADRESLFDVHISVWPFGRLVHYRGSLALRVKPLP